MPPVTGHFLITYLGPLCSRPTEDNPVDVKDTQEFAAFFSVLRSYHQDSALLENDTSQKASNFTVHFISPPFFSRRSEHFKYKEQTPWVFPSS
ncbi:hypothetical protein BD769DRAFT_1678855 [Suillus cothurnatus]|nr:hypothetical protein BD769DRAFT_1678855 [Suillus cothurnatus]